MSKQQEALRIALEALKQIDEAMPFPVAKLAQKVIKEALAQPEFIKHEVKNADDWSEWVCPDSKNYLMKCCDCGLVHEAEFGVVRYKSETERDDCDMVDDPNLQAVFRMRRSEQWSPEDTAHRSGGLPMAQTEPNYKKALEVWLEKTEWVQKTVKPHELGMHRADVLKQRIKEVLAQPKQDSYYGYKGKCNRVMSDGNPCGLNAPCPDCGLSLIDCPQPQPWEKFCDSNCVWTDHHPDCKLAQPEQDYKDLYEKEKRKSAMWLAKYEEIAGPAPKAIPMTEPEQEPCCYGGIAHDCHAGEGCRIAERMKAAQTEQKPVAWKLVPTEPTNEMLKAMDECSTEGYDERLLAGHASSVYMAAVDVAPTPPQKKWVGLTDEELPPLVGDNGKYMELQQVRRFYKYIEAKLKEKNT